MNRRLHRVLVTRAVIGLVLAALVSSCGTLEHARPLAGNHRPVLVMKDGNVPVPPPTKVIGMMSNYRPATPGAEPAKPGFFVRTPSSLASNGDVLEIHEVYDTVLYEGELVIVIGKRARKVSPEEARECILGYTCGMDGSPLVLDASGKADLARGLAGKSADGIAPVGPWVVTDIDPASQTIQLRVNGKVLEECFTGNLVWGPARIVSEVSRSVTLDPGDLIFSGASKAPPKFRPGDRVEVEITDIGILSNVVADGSGSE